MALFLLFWSLIPLHNHLLPKTRTRAKADTLGVNYVYREVPHNDGRTGISRGGVWQDLIDERVPGFFFNTGEFTGGSLAITYGLFKSDDEVYEDLHGLRMRSPVLSTVSPVVSMMGLGTFSIGVFGGFYLYHFATGDETSLRAANIGMESFLLSGISTQILKNLFGRERPSMATREGGRWSGPLSYFRHTDNGSKSIASYDAFPSGHTATIFAAAATIADVYHEPWVSYAAYATATLVGISRVMESAHWPSDVFVGSIIGIASTRIVEDLPFNRELPTVQFSMINNSYGATLSFKF